MLGVEKVWKFKVPNKGPFVSTDWRGDRRTTSNLYPHLGRGITNTWRRGCISNIENTDLEIVVSGVY